MPSFSILQIVVDSPKMDSKIFTVPDINVQYFGREVNKFLQPNTSVIVIDNKDGGIPSTYADELIEKVAGTKIFCVRDKCYFFDDEQTARLERVLSQNIANNLSIAKQTLVELDTLYNFVFSQIAQELRFIAAAEMGLLSLGYALGHSLIDLMPVALAAAAAIHVGISMCSTTIKEEFFKIQQNPAKMKCLDEGQARALILGYDAQKSTRGYFNSIVSMDAWLEGKYFDTGRAIHMAHDRKLDRAVEERRAKLYI